MTAPGAPYLACAGAGTGASLTVTIATSTAPGDAIVACTAASGAAVTSVTDSQGNSYALVASEAAGAPAAYVHAAFATTPLAAGTDWVRVTCSASASIAMTARGRSGITSAGVTATAGGTSASPSAGPAGPLASPSEWVVAAIAAGSPATTVTGWGGGFVPVSLQANAGVQVLSVAEKSNPLFGTDQQAPPSAVASATGISPLPQWRAYNQPTAGGGTGVPSSFPGTQAGTPPSGTATLAVSIKPGGSSSGSVAIPAVASGAYDADLAAWFAQVPANGVVTCWHEGETKGATPAQLVAMHAHVYPIFRAHAAAGAKYVQCFTTYTAYSGSSHYPLGRWICCPSNGGLTLDGYMFDAYPAPTTATTDWQDSFGRALTQLLAVIADPVVGVWETGTPADGDRPAWFAGAWSWALANNAIAFLPYFNSSTSYPWASGDTASIAALTAIGNLAGTTDPVTASASVTSAPWSAIVAAFGTTAAALGITTTSLPGATTGVLYDAALTATGGTGAGYSWSVSAGALPSGLTLSASGLISGVPAAAGTASFTVKVTDSAADSAARPLTLAVASGGTDTYSDAYSDLYSPGSPSGPAPAVQGTWTASWSLPLSGANPPPGTLSLPCAVANADGDWMIAVVGWVQADGYPDVTFTISDDAHNWWEPLAAPGGSLSAAGGATRVSMWMAPAARAATSVHAAPSGYSPAWAMTVYDVSGLPAWPGTAAVTAHSASASSLAVPAAAPASQVLAVTACAAPSASPGLAVSGGGWSAASTATASGGAASLTLGVAWKATTAAPSATWSVTAKTDLSAVTGTALASVAAPAAPNPAWPAVIYEAAPGSGAGTAPDDMAWAPLTGSALELSGVTQGRQYEAAQLSAGEGALRLDNPLGHLVPPGQGLMTGIDTGTPVRLRCAWQGGAWQVQFSGDGSHGGPYASTGRVFTVVAGRSYSASAWLSCSAPWAAGLGLVLAFCDAGGNVLAQAASAAQASGAAAVLAYASGTAPSGAVTAEVLFQASGVPPASLAFRACAALPGGSASRLVIPPDVTWLAGDSATVTTLAAFSPSLYGPPQCSPWLVPFSGMLERLPQEWDALLRGVTQASVTDAWFGVNYQPQPILVTEILNDFPIAYWPCTDGSFATGAANIAPGNGLPLAVTLSKYGSGGATQAFGQGNGGILGAQSTLVVDPLFRVSNQGGMWGQTLPSTSFLIDQGYCLSVTDPGMGASLAASTGAITLECWFQAQSPVPSYSPPVLAIGNSQGLLFRIALNPVPASGGFEITGSLIPGGYVLVSGANYYSASPGPLGFVAIVLTRTGWTLYVDGAETASGSFTGQLRDFSVLTAGGNGSLYTFGQTNVAIMDAFGGFIGHVAVFPRQLPEPRILTHYQAGATAMAGEPSQYRIERLLQAGGATGRRFIGQQGGDYLTRVVSCQDIPGQPASASISNIASNLLPGMLYVAPCGDIVHLSREAAWNQPVKWTLGEDESAGEIPYEEGIKFDYDPTRIQNQIQLTQLDSQNVVAPSQADMEAQSQKQYGTITNDATGYLQGDQSQALNFGPGLEDLANWQANSYKQPVLRLASVTVDASGAPYRWPFVLGVADGDMVRVNRRPPGSGDLVISVLGRVTQTERNIRFGVNGVAASVTCLIDPAPEASALTLGDPVKGVLNGQNVLAW